MNPDLDFIRRVTANYFFWQGFRWVPFGIMFLLMALHTAAPAWWPFTTDPLEDIFLLSSLAIAFICTKVISNYYETSYGRVKSLAGIHHRRDAIKWFMVYPIMFASTMIDFVGKPPTVFVTGPVWGFAIIAYWWSTGRGRRHYLFGAALLFALTPLPLLAGIANGKPMFVLFAALTGSVYVVGGILDHREFTRIMKTPAEESYANSL